MAIGKPTKWYMMAETPVKGERMPMIEDHFNKVITMRDELIFEQKEEIAKLKMTINKLRQKNAKV